MGLKARKQQVSILFGTSSPTPLPVPPHTTPMTMEINRGGSIYVHRPWII